MVHTTTAVKRTLVVVLDTLFKQLRISVCVQTRENPNPIQDERRLLQHTMFKRQFLSNNSAVCIHFSPLSQLLVYNTHWGKNPHFIQKITFLKSHFHKIHIFEISIFTKFTFLKYQNQGFFWIKSGFLP